jgi:hypothetical protein
MDRRTSRTCSVRLDLSLTAQIGSGILSDLSTAPFRRSHTPVRLGGHMRYLQILMIVALASGLAVSCKMKKEMSLQDYAKIESEINLPNPELDKAKVDEIAKKYGYDYQQYKDMFEKVQKDPKLKEQLGEMRLQEQKEQKK